MDLHALGFNDHFVDEVCNVLRPFRVVTTTLRNAAIHIVADRHSMYVGPDELPTRPIDKRRILTSPNLQPQSPRSAERYSTRLLARLGRLEDHETVARVLVEFPSFSLHSLKAAAACVVVGCSLTRVCSITTFQQRTLLHAIAYCLHTSYARIVQLFDNLPLPQTNPRRFDYINHLTPLEYEPLTNFVDEHPPISQSQTGYTSEDPRAA